MIEQTHDDTRPHTGPEPRPFRILFVGNSFTTRHAMPDLLAHVAAASGAPQAVETQVVAAAGASLAGHWNKGIAQQLLTQQRWDALVLQDQSTRALRAPKSLREYGTRFAEAAHASGVRPCFFITWARQDQPETQTVITSAYRELAHATASLPVPVGPAWQRVQQARPDISLYDADLRHPSLVGSYLCACVFCASLLGLKPTGAREGLVRLGEDADPLIEAAAQATAENAAASAAGG